MFERGKESRAGPVDVEIGLGDGRTLSGKLVVPPGRTLAELLNGSATFVEFEQLDGGRMYLAKAALHSVTPSNIPAAPDLWAGPTEGSGFDPFKVLGIGAERDARACPGGLPQARQGLSPGQIRIGRSAAAKCANTCR